MTDHESSRYGFANQSSGPMIVRAAGSMLYTADGRQILDGASGALVTNIGHGRPEVAAVAAQALLNVDYDSAVADARPAGACRYLGGVLAPGRFSPRVSRVGRK